MSDTHAADDEYSYVYAGLTWQEYWANEGVYNAGDVTSSNEKDTHGEYDKGGFDTVTRAYNQSWSSQRKLPVHGNN